MSNALAIAAVTMTLRNLLVEGFAGVDGMEGTEFSTLPLDVARTGTANQVNVFLYRASVDRSLRNEILPPSKPGEGGHSPLPLVLHYLVTAYGKESDIADHVHDHRVLGQAMSVFHDQPVLDRNKIAAALGESDLQSQIEGVRLTLADLSGDEISKLWTAFGGTYRLSVAYDAAVVLIDSRLPRRAPLPVLTRGPADRGPNVGPGLDDGFPAIESVVALPTVEGPPPTRPIRIEGRHLAGDHVAVKLMTARFADPVELAAAFDADGRIVADIPLDEDHPAGIYSVAVAVTAAGTTRTTPAVALELLPEITDLAPIAATRDAAGAVSLTLHCRPPVWPRQPVSLLIGDREVPAAPRAQKTGTLDFAIGAIEAGVYRIRLRVDFTDSTIAIVSADGPPRFDDSKRVTVR